MKTSAAKRVPSRRPSAEVRFQLAKALVRTGQLAEAHQHVQLALQSGVRDAQVYELAALLEGALGSARRADVYRRLAVSLDPGGSGWRSRGLTVGRVGEVARHASASR